MEFFGKRIDVVDINANLLLDPGKAPISILVAFLSSLR